MKKAYLIGHGNLEIEEFLQLLKSKGIRVLIDVRSVPYSRFASRFNREIISKRLKENSISYLYMGDMLGGRRDEGFDKYMQTPMFSKGIEMLGQTIADTTAAIMCSELDHEKCHRRFIGARLADRGFAVENISKEGAKEISQKTLGGFQA